MESIKHIIQSKGLFLIAGPCVIENADLTFEIASKLKEVTSQLNMPFIFKASYKKENRTKLNSFTGPGINEGIQILKHIKDELNIPITTDVHNTKDIEHIADIIDIIQIPAFLCRQTDILIAAAETNKYVNVKKGPFLSGESCQFIIEKIRNSGNNNIIMTERGNSFGYQDLVVDMRNISIINKYQVTTVLDATHSNQKPNQSFGKSGGTPEFIETLACAGVASGVNGIFLETHPDPKNALSDGSNMLPLHEIENLLKKLIAIKKAIS